LLTSVILLAAVLGSMSLGAYATNYLPQATTTNISFTMTTTSSYSITAGGNLQVTLDSIQISTPPPQAYSFGVIAQTAPGLWITALIWQFGDGAGKFVPYSTQSHVSETQYHAYSHPGSYMVVVWAYDNAGNSGYATVTVNWVTPVPEYSAFLIPMIITLAVTLVGVAKIKKRR
jgi:hypothetical protein